MSALISSVILIGLVVGYTWWTTKTESGKRFVGEMRRTEAARAQRQRMS
jgi:hypothetical protein